MVLILDKAIQEEGWNRTRYNKVDELDLGRYNTQIELYKKIYEKHGPGRFLIKDIGGRGHLDIIFKGDISESKPHILIQVEDSEEDVNLEKFGLGDPGWGYINTIKFPMEEV